MDPESSLYIMSALAHQKYTLSDGSFREIKHNTVQWNLFNNKRSGAVGLTPDSEGLGAAVVAGVGSKPHSVQWYFIFLPIAAYKLLKLNTFIPVFLKRTLPSLNLDMSTGANRGFSINSNTDWQTVYRSWWDGSSGSTLFAEVSVLVYRTERVKMYMRQTRLIRVFTPYLP